MAVKVADNIDCRFGSIIGFAFLSGILVETSHNFLEPTQSFLIRDISFDLLVGIEEI